MTSLTSHPSNSGDRHLLVTLANERMVEHAKQVFGSAVRHGWTGDLMLLTDGVPDYIRADFEDQGVIVNERTPPINAEEWAALGHDTYNPIVMLKYDLFLPEFKKWKTITYLDADIIVNGPIHKLTESTMLTAVPDWLNRVCDNFKDSEDAVAFGQGTRDMLAQSMNSGVFAFSPSTMPADTRDKLCALTYEYLGKTVYSDQSITNLYFTDWTALSFAYNFLHTVMVPFPFPARWALIIHFAGRPTPDTNPAHKWHKDWVRNREAFNNLKTLPHASNAWTESLRAAMFQFCFSSVQLKFRSRFRPIYNIIVRLLYGRPANNKKEAFTPSKDDTGKVDRYN